jgi:hypothetical protein
MKDPEMKKLHDPKSARHPSIWTAKSVDDSFRRFVLIVAYHACEHFPSMVQCCQQLGLLIGSLA